MILFKWQAKHIGFWLHYLASTTFLVFIHAMTAFASSDFIKVVTLALHRYLSFVTGIRGGRANTFPINRFSLRYHFGVLLLGVWR
jgi:hypothetical protein